MNRFLGGVAAAVAISLPAAASVGSLQPRPMAARELMAAVEAAPAAQARVIQFEKFSRVFDGVPVMDLDSAPDGKAIRRVVLRPDFRGGPGAALSVRF